MYVTEEEFWVFEWAVAVGLAVLDSHGKGSSDWKSPPKSSFNGFMILSKALRRLEVPDVRWFWEFKFELVWEFCTLFDSKLVFVELLVFCFLIFLNEVGPEISATSSSFEKRTLFGPD